MRRGLLRQGVAGRLDGRQAPAAAGRDGPQRGGFSGFPGRKGDGHPGPKALWEGLLKLMAYVEAFQAAREVYGEG